MFSSVRLQKSNGKGELDEKKDGLALAVGDLCRRSFPMGG
jgi:hypothetical protein